MNNYQEYKRSSRCVDQATFYYLKRRIKKEGGFKKIIGEGLFSRRTCQRVIAANNYGEYRRKSAEEQNARNAKRHAGRMKVYAGIIIGIVFAMLSLLFIAFLLGRLE